MRVNDPNGTAVAMASAATRRANGAGGFTPSESKWPANGRRHRCPYCAAGHRGSDGAAAPRSHKLALLSGSLESSALLGLKAVAADLRECSGDDKLDQVLNEIELRVAVELAKAGINQV